MRPSDNAKAFFRLLKAEKTEIAAALEGRVEWYDPKDQKLAALRVWYPRPSVNLENLNLWPTYHEWIAEQVDRMLKVVVPRVIALRLPTE